MALEGEEKSTSEIYLDGGPDVFWCGLHGKKIWLSVVTTKALEHGSFGRHA